MSKYINGDELLRKLPDDLPYKASVKRVLMQAPTTDVVEVRHGEYIQKGAWHIECCVCGNVLAHIGEVKNYCPNCGAKMDRERRENGT